MPVFLNNTRAEIEKMAGVVRDAGGELVGRARLQKVVYFLTVAGLEDAFRFSYKHYGPYSKQLADVAELAVLFDEVSEKEEQADWGGMYSIYSVDGPIPAKRNGKEPSSRQRIVSDTAKQNPIVLELAATAVFLSKEGFDDPWSEIARRKPVKYNAARYKSAQALLRNLKAIKVPQPLPDNVVA